MRMNSTESRTRDAPLSANEAVESDEDGRDHFLQTHTRSAEEDEAIHTSATVVPPPLFMPPSFAPDHHEPSRVAAAVTPLQQLVNTSSSSSSSANSDDDNCFTSSSLFPGFQVSIQTASFFNPKSPVPTSDLSWSEHDAAEETSCSSEEGNNRDGHSHDENHRPMQRESNTDTERQTKAPLARSPMMTTSFPTLHSSGEKSNSASLVDDRKVVPEVALMQDGADESGLLREGENRSAIDAVDFVPPSGKKIVYPPQKAKEGEAAHVTEGMPSPHKRSPTRKMRKKVAASEKDTDDGRMKLEGTRKEPLSPENLHTNIPSTHAFSHVADGNSNLLVSSSSSGVLREFTPERNPAHPVGDTVVRPHQLPLPRNEEGDGVAGRATDAFDTGTHTTVVVSDDVTVHRGPAPFRYLLFFIWLKAIGSYDSGAFSAALGAEDGIADEWSLDSIAQGTLTSSVFLGNVIGCPLAGHLFSLYDEKKTFGYALAFHLIFSVLFATFRSYYAALFNRFFIGVTLAFIVVYTPVWVDEFSPAAKQSMWQALQNVGVPVGVMLGFLLGSYFPTYTTLGWSFSFFLKGLLMIPTVLYLYQMDSRKFNSREEPTVVAEDIFLPVAEAWSKTKGPYKEKSREEARALRSTIQLLGESSNLTSNVGAFSDGEVTGVFVSSGSRAGWWSANGGSTEGSPLQDYSRKDSREAEVGHHQETDRGRKRGTRRSEGVAVSTLKEKRNDTSPPQKGVKEEEETLEEKGRFLSFRDATEMSGIDDNALAKSITSPFWRSGEHVSRSHELSSSVKSLPSSVLGAENEKKALGMKGSKGEAMTQLLYPHPLRQAPRLGSSPSSVLLPPPRSLAFTEHLDAGGVTMQGREEHSPVASSLAEDGVEANDHNVKMGGSRTTYLDTAQVITAGVHGSDHHTSPHNGRAAVCFKKCLRCIPAQLRTPVKAFLIALHQLCTNVVYCCSTLSMCCLYFTATGLQNFVTQYLRSEPFNASMKTIMLGFGGSVVTAPVLGVMCSGFLLDKLGGYSRHWVRTTLFSLFFGVLGCIGAVVCCFLTTTVSFLALMSVLLFCGGAVVPPGVGLTMASLPPSRRSAGAALSQTLYNLLGNFSGPLVCGAVAKWTGELRWGIITVLLFSILGVVPLFAIVVWSIASKKKKIR